MNVTDRQTNMESEFKQSIRSRAVDSVSTLESSIASLKNQEKVKVKVKRGRPKLRKATKSQLGRCAATPAALTKLVLVASGLLLAALLRRQLSVIFYDWPRVECAR